jgi:hypothetical protein
LVDVVASCLSAFCPQPVRARQRTIAIINATNTVILFFMVFTLLYSDFSSMRKGLPKNVPH